MRHLLVRGLFLLVFTFSCNSDDNVAESELEKAGLLGSWELLSRSIDGITPLIREVGYSLTLLEDSNREDLKGIFESESPGSETDGTFEINSVESTIRFEFGNRVLVYDFEVDEDALIFNYQEEGSDINEIWIRSEMIP